MKSLLKTTTAALLASTAMASAGGIERTGQGIDLFFEEGTVAQFSLAIVNPSVSEDASFEDMTPVYALPSGGFKLDYGSNFSVALLFDQPFGALVEYPITSAFPGLAADLTTSNMTALLGYDVNDRIVVYGGLAVQSTSAAAIIIPAPGPIEIDTGVGYGFVAGAAYQIPEYALRVSLTYRSQIDTTHGTRIPAAGGTVPDTSFSTPQSINLDFQSGINEKTLVFGSVRWVNWDAIAIIASSGATEVPLVDYTHDTIGYEIGVGRKLSEDLSGAVTVGYQSSDGEVASPLSPTDGRVSVAAALIYTMGDTEITSGVSYTWLGNTFADHPAFPVTGITFSDNTALAVGVSIKHTF